MSLDVTVGGPTADSYASLAEANAYNQARTFSEVWEDSETSQKEAALKQAARLLDSSFRWTGTAVDGVQALTWPRNGMFTRNGFPIAPNEIPKDLKNAQSEYARQLLMSDRSADNDAQKQGISSLKVGPVEIGYKDTSSTSDSIELRNADIVRMNPEFDYLSAAVPDAVRNLLVPSWYETALITTTTFLFETHQ